MKHPVVIDGEYPMMQIEVDGELRWREAYVDCSLGAGIPSRVKPETRENEILIETIDGRMMIVRGRG